MEANGFERRLAAILAADVVGYSRLMNQREEATLANLNECLALFRELIPAHGGRIFGGAGDSVIAEFSSTVEAVRCAIRIQQALDERNSTTAPDAQMQFRIGINVGDVMVEGDNLMGEGVNVAARLESLADPGGINVSADVYRQVNNKVGASFNDLGLRSLKNIPEPVQVYRVVMNPSAVAVSPPPGRTATAVLSARHIGLALAVVIAGIGVAFWSGSQRAPIISPGIESTAAGTMPVTRNKPTIAVMPLENIGDDPEQEYFANGMTDDLIIALTKIPGLIVIARDSTFYYKNEMQDIREIARKLNVRYLLRGSVRRSGAKVRINASLIDTSSGSHMWAESYDGEFRNIFALQDKITKNIASSLTLKFGPEDESKVVSPETTNPQAYEYFLLGREHFFRYTKEDNIKARRYFEDAIRLDKNFARAYAMLAWHHVFNAMNGWSKSREQSLLLAISYSDQAIARKQDLPVAYFTKGLAYREMGKYGKATTEAEKAVAIDSNYANAYVLLATLYYYDGRPALGVDLLKKAMRLHPHHPTNYEFHLGQAYYTLKRYPDAIAAFQRALVAKPTSQRLHVWLAAAHAMNGDKKKAAWVIEEILLMDPDISIARIRHAVPFKNPSDLEHLLEGLRLAGMPTG